MTTTRLCNCGAAAHYQTTPTGPDLCVPCARDRELARIDEIGASFRSTEADHLEVAAALAERSTHTAAELLELNGQLDRASRRITRTSSLIDRISETVSKLAQVLAGPVPELSVDVIPESDQAPLLQGSTAFDLMAGDLDGGAA